MTPSHRSRALGLLVPLVLLLSTGCWAADPPFGPSGGLTADDVAAAGTVGQPISFCTAAVWFRTSADEPFNPTGSALVDWGDGTGIDNRPLSIDGNLGRFCGSHTYARAGTYLAQVAYWPGYLIRDEVVVSVTEPDATVSIGCNPDGTSTVTVDASWLSADSYPLDPAVSWLWTWGDGSAAEVATGRPIGQHRYTPGTYRIWVATARGGAWLSATTVDVTVEPCTL